MEITRICYDLVEHESHRYRRWDDGTWQEYLFSYKTWVTLDDCHVPALEREYQMEVSDRFKNARMAEEGYQ